MQLASVAWGATRKQSQGTQLGAKQGGQLERAVQVHMRQRLTRFVYVVAAVVVMVVRLVFQVQRRVRAVPHALGHPQAAGENDRLPEKAEQEGEEAEAAHGGC